MIHQLNDDGSGPKRASTLHLLAGPRYSHGHFRARFGRDNSETTASAPRRNRKSKRLASATYAGVLHANGQCEISRHDGDGTHIPDPWSSAPASMREQSAVRISARMIFLEGDAGFRHGPREGRLQKVQKCRTEVLTARIPNPLQGFH